MAATRRAPGGGRKPLPRDRAQSAKVMVRLKPDLRQALEDLAKRNGHDLSGEIRDGLYYWLFRSGRPALHVGGLTSLIEMLVDRIEQRTKKRWIDDPVTGAYVRKLTDELIQHWAPEPTKKVTVPPEIDGIVGGLIALAEMFRRPPQGVPRIPPEAFVHGLELTRIMEDLGSGWERNRLRRRHK